MSQEEADIRRRRLFLLVFAELLYYFGASIFFQGSFLVFIRAIILISIGYIALELATMNILWPIARRLFQWREKKRRGKP